MSEENGKALAARAASPKPRRRPAASRTRIDIQKVLDAPIRLKQDGAVHAVHPFEAVLRQHVRKALVEKSVPSMQYLLTQAEKTKLIGPPPEPIHGGGVFTVPKGLPEEIERQIFEQRDGGVDQTPMARIIAPLLRVLSFQVIKRCFNGR